MLVWLAYLVFGVSIPVLVHLMVGKDKDGDPKVITKTLAFFAFLWGAFCAFQITGIAEETTAKMNQIMPSVGAWNE